MLATTKIIHSIPVDQQTGAISVPIYQTSTFVQEAPGVNKGFDYSRTNNPTRKALEDLVASLENGHAGFAFGSGLAAIDCVIKLLSAGDEILAVSNLYGGTFRLFDKIFKKFGITVNYTDTTDWVNVVEAITDNTKMIWLETPTNPCLQISDIEAIGKIAHQYGAYLVVDNTFASPVLQKPLDFGADIVVHSATKYIAGHSDVIAGLVIVNSEELAEEVKFIQNACGGILGPFDSWLTIRGIETISLRMDRISDTALKIAQYLKQHELVDVIHYPGLPSHPNHHIACKQQTKFGGIISFSLKQDRLNEALDFVSTTKLFKLAESLGGVKSLIAHAASMTHKTIPRVVRHQIGVQDSLIRLSVGIEDVEDLIEDLEQAFEKVGKNGCAKSVVKKHALVNV
ncbi:MAG: PLP-dependent aspartate aminotransferase family protein [Chitinophagales bacterium]